MRLSGSFPLPSMSDDDEFPANLCQYAGTTVKITAHDGPHKRQQQRVSDSAQR